MKFATFMMQTQPSSLAAVARKAEELGFESLWIPEHIILPVQYKSPYPYSSSGRMPAPPETPLHDPMLALAYVAGITSTIRLATGIFVLPIRNPFATAKAVASLDVLSGGRFIFGVGIGWLEEEFAAVGMTFKDRALRSREYLELMKELWTSSDPVYKGKTVSTEGCRFMPKPVQKPHPPIVFGGHTSPALRRAARLGDGWYGIAESIDGIRETIGQLRERERELKRESSLEITISPRIGQPLTPALVKQFADMDVSRIIFAAGPSAREQIAGMERFRDDVMSKS
jgi:probable F420-dependent oxidoreductase